MSLVIPAVLPSSRKEFEETLELLYKIPSIERVQIDVVDGKFASPTSWPFSNLPEFKSMIERDYMFPHLDRFEYEIDLMCANADKITESWLTIGASRLVFHAESVMDLPRFLASTRKRFGGGGLTPLISFGLALNIASDLAIIEPCISSIDFVQFMGIARIGKQGQQFDEKVFEKVRLFRKRHPEIPIQVDGGVSLINAKELISLGVSNLVIGSAIVRAKNPSKIVSEFDGLQSPYGV